MKYVLINGPSCVGKRTILNNILSKKDDYFKLSYDSFKRLFSKYSKEKHSKDVGVLMEAITKSVIDMKYNILSDYGLRKEGREKMISLAKTAGYEIIEVNLEADHKILSERFSEKIKNSTTLHFRAKPTNFSPERHKELCSEYEQDKNPSALTFRTDQESAEEIERKILELL